MEAAGCVKILKKESEEHSKVGALGIRMRGCRMNLEWVVGGLLSPDADGRGPQCCLALAWCYGWLSLGGQ